jgi:cell division cycle 20-like protein 1 (cofactor of APC complex)
MPSPGKSVIYSDRMIPSRLASNLEDAFDMIESHPESGKRNNSVANRENQEILNGLLRSELLGQPSAPISFGTDSDSSALHGDGVVGSPGRHRHSSGSGSNSVLKYQSPHKRGSSAGGLGGFGSPGGGSESHLSSSSMSSIPASPSTRIGLNNNASTQKRQQMRKIPRKPYKILEAPNLHDDYYLNLVDWSHSNVVAVALGSCVYLWSAHTAKVSWNSAFYCLI